MPENKIRVSIGLPVFNGAKFLEKTLDSILAQTYRDFELIISDNASTDETPQICLKYAAKDERIRFYRNKINYGASRNHNRVFELSTGSYFKWAAHDDLLAPEYLSKCVRVLDRNPSIVLCHSKVGRINEDGKLIGNYDNSLFVQEHGRDVRIDSPRVHERFSDLISDTFSCWYIFGLIRTRALKMTPLMNNYVHSDRNLQAELGLIGRIKEVPEYLFFRRDHLSAYTNIYFFTEEAINYQEQLSWWTTIGGVNFGSLINFVEFFKSVRRIPLTFSERLLCYKELFNYFLIEGWLYILDDLDKIFLSRSKLISTMIYPIKWYLKHEF